MIRLLVGMIASGKSTYAREEAKMGAIVVNDDAIVELVHGGNYDLYDKKLKPLYKSIETSIIHAGVMLGRNVLVDRTNLSPFRRRRYIEMANSLDTPIEAIVFEAVSPEEHAKRRAESDGRGYDYDYWLRVAKFHWSEMSPPMQEEGFSRIIRWPEDGFC